MTRLSAEVALFPYLACTSGNVADHALAFSTTARSVSQVRVDGEAILVQTAFSEALGH
jgi:hypothetical protein